ncbi:hypothetical protein JG687_00012323 [Phytophthora cactorum]|uniref:Uncharacterized protein n=1 Tax=Phytophthora cactorum TaxID=29920 RepID=A0A329REP3_9STRA|nr:hypothetical protein Pcac1_g10621 [Phytophthora cactorum]KAG2810626.1 hypothetical protein PC111_g15572 [Phytophthora cactorum]KAG2819229.1 hypothetical protein PC112_g12281 [Phytophthora cactorum]KAG2838520.1 hypothetical protein PC113_g19651 [Phytophthora cactorum]KAG2900942.1 hypothetical protein PC114_g13381 [Phytophthora cactorum]
MSTDAKDILPSIYAYVVAYLAYLVGSLGVACSAAASSPIYAYEVVYFVYLADSLGL